MKRLSERPVAHEITIPYHTIPPRCRACRPTRHDTTRLLSCFSFSLFKNLPGYTSFSHARSGGARVASTRRARYRAWGGATATASVPLPLAVGGGGGAEISVQ